MPDRDVELLHLDLVDRHIAGCRLRIRRQIALIRRCTADGHDVSRACALLAVMRESQHTLRLHRQTILANLHPGGATAAGRSWCPQRQDPSSVSEETGLRLEFHSLCQTLTDSETVSDGAKLIGRDQHDQSVALSLGWHAHTAEPSTLTAAQCESDLQGEVSTVPYQSKWPKVPAEPNVAQAPRRDYSAFAKTIQEAEDAVNESRRLLDALYQRRGEAPQAPASPEGAHTNLKIADSVREDDLS